MSYMKLDENNKTVKVSEAKHFKEFMATIPNVKTSSYETGKKPLDLVSLGGGTSFEMFRLVLEGKLLVPDSIRARVVAAMNYQLLRELEKVESLYEPKKQKFYVKFDMLRKGVHELEVEATSENEAIAIAQKIANDAGNEAPSEFPSDEFVSAKVLSVVGENDDK